MSQLRDSDTAGSSRREALGRPRLHPQVAARGRHHIRRRSVGYEAPRYMLPISYWKINWRD